MILTLLIEIFRKDEYKTKDCAHSSGLSQVNHKLRNSTSAKYKTSQFL